MSGAEGEGDDDVGSDRAKLLELGLVAAGHDDFGRAEVFCQLYGETAGGAGRAVDQDGLAGFEGGALDQGGPGGHAGVGEGGGGDVVQGVGDFYAATWVDGALFGEGAVGGVGKHEVDAPTVLRASRPHRRQRPQGKMSSEL